MPPRGAARKKLAEQAELLVAVRLIAAELESGAGPPQALRAAAVSCPTWRAEFDAAARRLHEGSEVGFGAAPLAPLGAAWRISEATGAPLRHALGRVGDDLAAALEQHRAAGAALAGPRSSAVLVAALPLLGLALGSALGAHPLAFLLGPGRVVLVIGLVLDLTGLLWVRRLIRTAATCD